MIPDKDGIFFVEVNTYDEGDVGIFEIQIDEVAVGGGAGGGHQHMRSAGPPIVSCRGCSRGPKKTTCI